nr:hypothetical protein [Pseudonocardia sp. HH130629-09]
MLLSVDAQAPPQHGQAVALEGLAHRRGSDVETVEGPRVDLELCRDARRDQPPGEVEVLVDEQVEGRGADIGGWQARQVGGARRAA